MEIPSKLPEKGFYYHYKHNSAKGIQDLAYEYMGVGFHTEDDCRPEDKHMVAYRQLYKPFNKEMFFIRPLAMFIDNVTKEGKTFPRFQKITDPKVIAKLKRVRSKMYKP